MLHLFTKHLKFDADLLNFYDTSPFHCRNSPEMALVPPPVRHFKIAPDQLYVNTFASNVFPQPGGPASNIPGGLVRPS
jgi:hypothetical protein